MACSKLVFMVPLIFIIFAQSSDGWKAVPANQAVYALRADRDDQQDDDEGDQFEDMDDVLPRTSLHSVYKFGWCRSDLVKRQYLRKNVTMHFINYFETTVKYIYLLDHRHTQRYAQQCVVMKFYTPKKYMLRRSRLPMYYCQGQVHYLIMNTIQKIQIHEFYIVGQLLMPVDIKFEFYHPPHYHVVT